jgi:hypothetical protein
MFTKFTARQSLAQVAAVAEAAFLELAFPIGAVSVRQVVDSFSRPQVKAENKSRVRTLPG